MAPTPISVFTGFLGAGKTTQIISLLEKLPKGYNICLLKNEFGDLQVDSALARQSNLTAVSEILNGCMCCVLVGQMKNALIEIKEKFDPDRIIIETSGSAFPATLAFQIRELERETGNFKLDAIVTVVDAENFMGYEDTSPTAKMQASYTDLILITKWEKIPERTLDLTIDHLNTLNDLTPKIKCTRDGVDPSLVFGLDSQLFNRGTQSFENFNHNEEVETRTVIRRLGPQENPVLTTSLLEQVLSNLPKETVWRVKGMIKLDEHFILNWSFGRHELTRYQPTDEDGPSVSFTMMGERGETKRFAQRLAEALGAELM